MTPLNRQYRLAARPVGLPRPTDWNVTEERTREPADGEMLVQVHYISLDPAMRGWMSEGRSYIEPVALGDVMREGAAGAVGSVDGQIAKIRDCRVVGIDVYFDNVGGDILDAALARLARHARVVICGAISQYNATTGIKGPSNYLLLLVNRASMTGMVVFDYADRYAEAVQAMAGWMAAGKLKSREEIVTGLDHFPDALLMLFRGANTGKLVLKIAGD